MADIVQAAGYSPPSTENDKATMTKGKAVATLGSVTIDQIDGDGNALESWTLWNAWIAELKFGDLEYGSDDLTEISVTLKYDWATLSAPQSTSDRDDSSANSAFTINSAGG